MNHSLDQLLAALTALPGIGQKSAQRIAFYLLKNPALGKELTAALSAAFTRLRLCSICFNLTEDEICAICANQKRDHSIICVVEEPADLLALEATGQHRGSYHVLGGVLSPIDNINPEDLHIPQLIARVKNGPITEVIIATNPTTEGEATAIYIAQQLKPLGVRVTRIARGLPVGSELELADRETIARSLEGRREL